MHDELSLEEVATATDVDQLWRGLLAAKAGDDPQLVRAIERRMRELRVERRFAHLTDDQLRAQIAGMFGNREPQNMLGYAHGGAGAGGRGAEDIAALNRAIKANQRDGVEVTLSALLDELERREGRRPTGEAKRD